MINTEEEIYKKVARLTQVVEELAKALGVQIEAKKAPVAQNIEKPKEAPRKPQNSGKISYRIKEVK